MGEGAANYGNQPYTEIDLDAMTHLIMFNASLDSNGIMNIKEEWDHSLTWGSSLLEKRRKPFNEFVHSRGKCILLTIFGVGGGDKWTKMVSNPISRANAIRTIIDSVILEAKYDGVDLDIEPLTAVDTANTRKFIQELRDSLQKYHAWFDRSKKPILTAAVYTVPEFWASVAQYLDQVNIMTYDMDGLWTTKMWHNCPVYTAGATDTYGNPLASIHRKTQIWRDTYNIPREKLGCGVSTYAHIWKGGRLKNNPGEGITAPLQEWDPNNPPTKVYSWGKEYYWLRKNYLDTVTVSLHYDEPRKVPYIGVDSVGYEADMYITFTDTLTMREVVVVADTMNIGGIIFYDVQAQYLNAKDFPALAERNPLLSAIKTHAKNKLIPDAPKGFLIASKKTVPAGGDTLTLTWSSENATSALMDFVDSSTIVPLSGSVKVNVTSNKTFTLALSNKNFTIYCFVDVVVSKPTSVIQSTQSILRDGIFHLEQNYPNPFNGFTYISFRLFERAKIRLCVYDIYGREVCLLINGEREAGEHGIKFDLSNLASGVYFYRMQAGGYSATKSMLHLK